MAYLCKKDNRMAASKTDNFLTIFRRAKARKVKWQADMEQKLNDMAKEIEASKHSNYLDLEQL